MPRRYNLRSNPVDVKWMEDDTIQDKESEEEEEEEEEYETSESEEEEEDQRFIQIPMPKKGMSVKIEINNDDMDEDDMDEDEEEEDEFIGYLMDKYVPKKKQASSDKEEETALSLNEEEQEYYNELPKSKKKKLAKQMKDVSKLVSDSDVPYKFRVLELPIHENTKASVIKKIDILNEIGMESGESYKLRAWVDGFLRIPFGVQVPLPVKLSDGPKPCSEFLATTRKTLDSAVYGMNSAKTQIMQILAQWISNPGSLGNVIALRGPMGVGKTSFAKNGIAKVLGRPFQFFSLGGATDSSTFVGHGYTYEGSTWGRIADSLMSSRCMNPVMYFDELDKISTTAHGEEIVSLLIHMTDRTQNSQFHDRFFAGVDFDLSNCLFVFSFNDESKVHPILKDRMQVIHCSGYTSEDKKTILTQYIWPQMLERIKVDISITEDAIKFLIEEYSKEEEGVRNLIRAVDTLVTRINLLRIADEETAKSYPFYQKVEIPCKVDTPLARHILQEVNPPANESWKHLYV